LRAPNDVALCLITVLDRNRKAFDLGYSDLLGGRVMAEQKLKNKGDEEKKPEFKKTPEYRRFKKLLKQVIKAPLSRKRGPIHSDG